MTHWYCLLIKKRDRALSDYAGIVTQARLHRSAIELAFPLGIRRNEIVSLARAVQGCRNRKNNCFNSG